MAVATARDARCKRASLFACVAGFFAFITPEVATARAIWPVDLTVCGKDRCVVQGYAEQVDKENPYHTGVDITADYGTSVQPVAKGVIIQIQKEGTGCWTTERSACKDRGDEPDDPTETIKSGTTTIYYYEFHSDHGYGNTVVIWHPELGVYSQYSHLANIPDKAILGSTVDPIGRKSKIGEVGQSGVAQSPHLHFEIKNFSGLRNIKKEMDECSWGYSTQHPDECGYNNPVDMYIYSVRRLPQQTAITPKDEVKKNDLKIRRVPTVYSWPLGAGVEILYLQPGERAWAEAEVEKRDTYCASGWYRLRGPFRVKEPFLSQNDIRDVTLEKAWVCKDWVSRSPRLPGTAAPAGLATALVIDTSGSMDWQSSLDSAKKKIDIAREAANLFVDAAQPQESCSVSVFSATGSTDPELAMAACGEIAGRVKPTLAGVPATGGTNIGGGLDAAFQELLKIEGSSPKFAVLLSDGANTLGKWRPSACKFARPGIAMCSSPGKDWPVYTVGLYTDRAVLQKVVRGGTFGSQAMSTQTQEENMRTTLTQIADMTGGRFYPPSTANLGSIFAQIRSHASGGSTLLSQGNFLPRNGSLDYNVGVTPGAQNLTVIPTWFGSSIDTVLVSPSGRTIRANDLMPPSGRYVQGATYEIVQVNRPMGGEWQVRLKWADPPEQAEGERVNLIISEKTDISLNLLGFKGEYEIGEPVMITLDVAEYAGGERIALADARVRVQVQKPGGTKMVRLVRTRPINRRLAKRTIRNATRNVRLYDDGAHQDYRAGDGIFGGTFTETGENGAYLVTATVTGHKRNGQRVQRKLIASFQVGPIAQNPVTTAQILEVRDLLEGRTDPAEAIEALRSDPLAAIKGSQSDPLDAINKLRQGVQ